MNKAAMLLTGVGVGAGLMYILDPDRGRRRRALARDKAVGTWNRSSRYVAKVGRDMANRGRGLAHEAKASVAGEHRGEEGGPTRPDVMNENWSPATRVVASALGGGLALYGYRRGGFVGKTASALGIGLLTRGIMNQAMAMPGSGPIGKIGDEAASLVGSGIESVTHPHQTSADSSRE